MNNAPSPFRRMVVRRPKREVGNLGKCEFNEFSPAIASLTLPPLAGQRRIVAKVDELMAVLDALEAALTAARAIAENLLAVTVARLHAA